MRKASLKKKKIVPANTKSGKRITRQGKDEIPELIEDGYGRILSTGADKNKLDSVFDFIRSYHKEKPGPFDFWQALDFQIGRADDSFIRSGLIGLRDRFEKSFRAGEVDRLEKAFKRSPGTGWKELLIFLTEAVTYFRFQFCSALCDRSFRLPTNRAEDFENIRKAVRYMLQGRWIEACDHIAYLSGLDFIPKEHRARLNVILGEIQLYHISRPDKARRLFESAGKMTPGEARVINGMGEYRLAKNDYKKAREYFEKAIKRNPGYDLSYTNMGDLCQRQRQYDDAEAWYWKAIEFGVEGNWGYVCLFQLYGRDDESFVKHKDSIFDLLERATAIDPDGVYDNYIELGYLYQQNKRYADAHEWFEKAIRLDGRRLRGYVENGSCYREERQDEQAERNFRDALEAASADDDVYYIALLYEKLERWDDALDNYKKCLNRMMEGEALIRAKLGELHKRLASYSAAEEELKKSLKIDRGNQRASIVLQEIAVDYYKKMNDPSAAEKIYRDLLRIKGASYKADYHNQIGNMKYYLGEYAAAAKEYSYAVSFEPGRAVFHSNLAHAYRDSKNWEKAAEELGAAFELDRDDKTYKNDMALLLNAEGNDFYSQGDYKRAIDKYEESIRFNDNDAIVYSNLGGAWELLKETGMRAVAMENAIEAFEHAHRLDLTGSYDKEIDRLKRKREFIISYGERSADWLHVVTPVAIEVAADLIRYTEGKRDTLSEELQTYIAEMRERILNKFGVKVPGIRFRGNETDLPDGTYIIMLMEIPVVSGSIFTEKRFFPGANERLTELGISGEESINPANGGKGYWIAKGDWEKLETDKDELWDIIEYPIRHLESVLVRNLAEFVGHQEVMNLFETDSPDTYDQLRKLPAELTALTNVCRGLVSEEVSLQSSGAILQKFNQLRSEECSLQDIVEEIRCLPGFRPNLAGSGREYELLKLGQRFETEIQSSIYRKGSRSVLAMEPSRCQDVLTSVRNHFTDNRRYALLVEKPEIRHFVRKLVELEFPGVPVLSRRELLPEVEYNNAEVVELEQEQSPPEYAFARIRESLPASTAAGEARQETAIGRGSNANDVGRGGMAIQVFVRDVPGRKKTGGDEESFERMLDLMRDGLFYELGIILPEIRIEADQSLSPDEFRFELNDTSVGPFAGLREDEFLVNDTVDRLALLNVRGRETLNPANGSECAVVLNGRGEADLCQQAGLTTWGPSGFIVLALSSEIRKVASSFLTTQVVRHMLESFGTAFPDLVDTFSKRFGVEELRAILGSLLDEDISIRDIRSILESLLSIDGTTDVDFSRFIVFTPNADGLCPVDEDNGFENLNVDEYENFVRMSLKRYISHKYTRGGSTLVVYLADSELEKLVASMRDPSQAGGDKRRILDAVSAKMKDLSSTGQNPVILTSCEVRKKLWRLVHGDFPHLGVVSYQELSPDTNIQPIDRISIEGNEEPGKSDTVSA